VIVFEQRTVVSLPVYIGGIATKAAQAQMTQDRDSELVHVARMRVSKLLASHTALPVFI